MTALASLRILSLSIPVIGRTILATSFESRYFNGTGITNLPEEDSSQQQFPVGTFGGRRSAVDICGGLNGFSVGGRYSFDGSPGGK